MEPEPIEKEMKPKAGIIVAKHPKPEKRFKTPNNIRQVGCHSSIHKYHKNAPKYLYWYDWLPCQGDCKRMSICSRFDGPLDTLSTIKRGHQRSL